MSNHQLEQALFYAVGANDIASLKSLARQEGARAEQLGQLLAAVLTETGPTRLPISSVKQDNAGFTMTLDGDDWVVLAAIP